MEPNPNIKSRLGFGRCSSPPPPELDDMDDSSLKTELRKTEMFELTFPGL